MVVKNYRYVGYIYVVEPVPMLLCLFRSQGWMDEITLVWVRSQQWLGFRCEAMGMGVPFRYYYLRIETIV